jgi:serine carboxypeptidase-like clade II
MYAGYVTIPADQHTLPNDPKQLFYWLTEADPAGGVDPKTAPLVLWLNGGPGCSSIAGLLSENGPFRATQEGSGELLEMRPERWNLEANMLFLDSPAGVGYSTYKPTFSDDNTTAADTYAFLQGWLDKFPQYRGRDFFVTGESYAGHYIPTLVKKIVEGNNAGEKPIQLRGFAVGNPTTNISSDFFFGTMRSWFANGLIPQTTWEAIQENCWGHWLAPQEPCQKWLTLAQKEMGDINPYDINVKICPKSSKSTSESKSHPMQFVLDQLAGQQVSSSANQPFPYWPCEDKYFTEYLNRADVKAALHVNASTSWAQCSDIKYNYTNFYDSMLPIYEKFLGPNPPAKLDIWVYSGMSSILSFCLFVFFLSHPHPSHRNCRHGCAVPRNAELGQRCLQQAQERCEGVAPVGGERAGRWLLDHLRKRRPEPLLLRHGQGCRPHGSADEAAAGVQHVQDVPLGEGFVRVSITRWLCATKKFPVCIQQPLHFIPILIN